MNRHINIAFPDGRVEIMPGGITASEIAQSISVQFEKQVVVAKVNDILVDLSYSIQDDAKISFYKGDSPEGHDVLLHSTSHLMAQAVKRLFPNTKVTIGPSIDNGFYYDFDTEKPFSPEQLVQIEAEMAKIVKEDLPVTRVELSKADAIEKFAAMDESYKVDIINSLPENEVITAYSQGDFIDLCRGPHLKSTGRMGVYKLLSVAGAYWRGDEKNKMLSRIYGTSFSNKKELKKYLHLIEEAKRRDHRLLGKELGWFSFHNAAPANVFFHEKGTSIYNAILDYVRESNRKYGYEEVNTPLILSEDLWRQSGHYENYRDNMYFTKVDDRDFAVKPMNCPGHTIIFANDPRSYRDLPIRMSEFGRVHRHEKSGVTHGLFRVRTFVQDDAHVFCTEDQILDEVKSVIDQIYEVYKAFGFENLQVELSTRPEKSIGSDEMWNKAEKALETVLTDKEIHYKLNPGDGAFYGPKIDFHINDSLNRTWQCGTIQLDFSMPERFNLNYTAEDGKYYHPVMIHRAVLGSLERFMGILIEHFAAKMPLWLSPHHIQLIPIADRHLEYSYSLLEEFKRAGLRVSINEKNEKIGQKIRQAEMSKIPYMAIIGDQEVDGNVLALRRQGKGDMGSFNSEQVIAKITEEIKEKVY